MTMSEILLYTILSISPVNEAQATDDAWLDEQVECMALNVYHEARGHGTAGRLAVMAVTSNRVQDSRYPNTICEVVKQGPTKPSWKGTGEMIPVRHRCQFSWYCDGKSDTTYDKRTYDQIHALSALVIKGEITVLDLTEGATHYHADYVSPAWAKTKTKTIEIEDHIFYRWEK